jgi:MFS family permease
VAQFRGLSTQFWIVWVGTLLNRAGAFVVPFLALYITSARGLSEAAAGFVVSAYGAGSLTAAFVGGSLADHVGRRRTILISLFGGACPMVTIAFVRPFWGIVAATFLMGAMSEMYRPAVQALVADVVPVEQRPRAYGLMYWAHNLGFALAPSLAGLLSHSGFTSLFIVDAGTMIAYGIIVFFLVSESRPEKDSSGRSGKASARALLDDHVFIYVVLLTFGTAVVMWQNGVSLPLDMKRTGHDARSYGLLIATNGVLIVFVQPFLTKWFAKRNRTKVLFWSSLIFGTGIGLYALVTSAVGYAIAIAIWTIGEIGLLPTLSAVIADLAPASMRGRYQGASNMAWGLAACVGPVTGGAALLHLGPSVLWGSCALVMLGVAATHLAIGKQVQATIVDRVALVG